MPRIPRPCGLLSVVLLLALAWGCGSDDAPTEPDPGPDLSVASLTVTPAAAAFAALGDTLRFAAVARNADGDTVAADLAWSSTDPSIASVDAAGLVEATGGGAAAIIATAEGHADTAAVTVTLTTLVWKAAVSGSWHDPERWRGGVVPQPSDTVRIAIAGDYTVSLEQDTEIARLELGGSGGPQTLATGAHTLSVGSLLLDGDALLDVGGTVAVSDATDWRSGNITGGGTVRVGLGGELLIGGGAPILELEATLVNEGTVAVVSGARLDIPGPGRLENPAGAVLDLRSDGSVLPYDGGAVISEGRIRKTGGATVSALGTSSGVLRCEGAIEITSGALRIASGEVLGEVDIAPGLRLEVLGGTTLGSGVTFTNAGSLDIDGSVTIGEETGRTIAIPYLVLNNGTVGGGASIAVADSLVWLRGSIAGEGEVSVPAGARARLVSDDFSKLLSGRGLRIGGELSTGSSLDLELAAGAAITVESTGRWRQGYRGRIRPAVGGGGSLRVDGVFTKTDPETTLVGVPLLCTGSLELEAGILVATDTVELTGTSLLRGGGRVDQLGQNLRLAVSDAHGATLAGAIEPDSQGQPAWLEIAGPVSLASTTVIRVELAEQAPGRAERLNFTDPAVFAGTVEVTVSLVPQPLDNFRVVSRAPHASRFDQVVGATGFEVNEDDSGLRLIWPEER